MCLCDKFILTSRGLSSASGTLHCGFQKATWPSTLLSPVSTQLWNEYLQKKRKPQNELSVSTRVILHGTQMMPVAKAGPWTELVLDHAKGIRVGWAVGDGPAAGRPQQLLHRSDSCNKSEIRMYPWQAPCKITQQASLQVSKKLKNKESES